MSRVRVLVVDDSAVFRRAIADALTSDPDIGIAGTAPNGKIALAKISQINPDVVTLDIEMPEMDELTTLREIRKRWPRLPVLMFSTHTEPAAAATVEALLAGATDYATKPTSGEGVAAVRGKLIPKVKAAVRRAGSGPLAAPAAVTVAPRLPADNRGPPSAPKIVAIGVSTGGPLRAHHGGLVGCGGPCLFRRGDAVGGGRNVRVGGRRGRALSPP